MKEQSIGEIVKDSFFGDDAQNLVKDVLENQCEIEILEKVPIVSYAVSLLKIKDCLRDRLLLRKFVLFMNKVRNGCVSSEDREKAVSHFYKNEDEYKQELTYLMLVLDHYIEEDKSMWLALVYCEFIRGNVDLNHLKIYAEAISNFLPGDVDTLRLGEKEYRKSDEVPASMLRLSSLGLMQKIVKIICNPKDVGNSFSQEGSAISPYENGSVFKYTQEGFELRKILFPSLESDDGILKLDMSQGLTLM